ncbi:hypothetical protein F5B18DRAFT_617690 [Nemania serpens]|nr:hypothetical protein F5B18DRAFT_617690 [Nemania serpens]
MGPSITDAILIRSTQEKRFGNPTRCFFLANCSTSKYSQGHWYPGLRVPLVMSWSMKRILMQNQEGDLGRVLQMSYHVLLPDKISRGLSPKSGPARGTRRYHRGRAAGI